MTKMEEKIYTHIATIHSRTGETVKLTLTHYDEREKKPEKIDKENRRDKGQRVNSLIKK
jgi:hypothetical protein